MRALTIATLLVATIGQFGRVDRFERGPFRFI